MLVRCCSVIAMCVVLLCFLCDHNVCVCVCVCLCSTKAFAVLIRSIQGVFFVTSCA